MSKKEKEEKKEKKEKKKEKKESSRSTIKCIEGTVIPVAFEDFLDRIEELGEISHKETVTTLRNDDAGLFLTIPKQGSTKDKISLFLNKSRGWKSDEDYSALEIDTWHTGDVRVNVTDSPKSMKQAFKISREWMKAKEGHTPTPAEKKEKKEKSDKKEKKSKKHNGEDSEMSMKERKRRKKAKKAAEAEADA